MIDAALREQLVAYLDGELDSQTRAHIELLLANDPQVRASLQELDRTWELLDKLDAAPPCHDFTRTTLEMVAVAATDDTRRPAGTPGRRRLYVLLTGGGLLLAILAGFLAVSACMPDPNRQLLHDLPLLENLDQFRQVDSIDFLRLLVRDKVFADAAEAPADPGDSLAERRQFIESLSTEQKDHLLRHQQQFQALEPAQQQRLRQLYREVQHDPEAEKLREAAGHYCQFLAALLPLPRNTIEQLPPAARIKQIRQIKAEQTKSAAREPNAADREGLARWMDRYAQQHETRFLDMLGEPRRQQFAKLTPAVRHHMVLTLMCQRWQSATAAAPLALLSAADLAGLRQDLSPETRTRLETKTPAEQWQTVAGWIRQVAHQHLAAHPATGRGEKPLLPNFDEQLAQFFELQLGDPERERLLAMPGDEMQQRLRELYLLQMRPADPAHHAERPGYGKKRPDKSVKIDKTGKADKTNKKDAAAKPDKGKEKPKPPPPPPQASQPKS